MKFETTESSELQHDSAFIQYLATASEPTVLKA